MSKVIVLRFDFGILRNKRCQTSVVGRHARGILIDPGEESIEQIAEALDYLIFNKGRRLRMERQSHQRGYQMRWYNSAWALLHHLDFISEQKELKTGRGITFRREKTSIFQKERHIPIQDKQKPPKQKQ